MMTSLIESGAMPRAFRPSPIGFSILRPRFFAIASSKPVSTTKVPEGPTIAHTK
jgi:hypothetical protein